MTTLGILRKLADISGQELCDNDGEYLFPNGGLIKISSLDRYAKEEWARYCEIVQHNKDLAEHNKIHLTIVRTRMPRECAKSLMAECYELYKKLKGDLEFKSFHLKPIYF